jgi:hypothetical protein
MATMSSGHCSQRLRGEARQAQAGGTGRHDAGGEARPARAGGLHGRLKAGPRRAGGQEAWVGAARQGDSDLREESSGRLLCCRR